MTAIDQVREELAIARAVSTEAEQRRRATAVEARAAELAAQQANARVEAYMTALDSLTRMPDPAEPVDTEVAKTALEETK